MAELSENKKFYTVQELKDKGFSYYRMNRLEAEGALRKANKGVYENLSYYGEENDFYSAEAYIPGGVICLLSAARYYGLTNFLPDAVDVAINRKKKVTTLPDWPEIRLHYYDPHRLDLGVREIREGENRFHIFDMEKTVIDILYFRNKTGIEETGEILRNYLKRTDRNPDQLFSYAKKLRTEKILRTYLEVLL